MSTTYTNQQLANRVLKDLGIYGPDETPSAADQTDTIEIINSEIASMSHRGIPIWGGSEMVLPQDYLSPLSRRLGLSVGPTFGMQLDQATLAIEAAEMYLRQLTAKPDTGAVQEIAYF
jgi:hypothetical protein